MQETKENVKNRYTHPVTGRFIGGNPGGGRPLDTPEKKIEKKVIKQIVEEYKESLANALPSISPILVAKSLEGDVSAIKEIHDRVMGKAISSVDVTSGGDKIQFNIVSFKDEHNDTI